jgi:hypothetical protein
MRIPPQVSERVKEAPAQALRAVFSGIGQVLLVADRIKNRAAEPDRARPANGPSARPGPAAAPVLRDETRWRSLDTTGNVRLLSEDDAARAEPPAAAGALIPEPEPVPEPQPVPEPELAAETTAESQPAVTDPGPPAAETEPGPLAAETAAPPEPAEPLAAAPAGPEAAERSVPAEIPLPVPNYDNLTIASLRARLRNLDRSQVRDLLDYEKANAGRAEVLTMFERRIVKLESNGS